MKKRSMKKRWNMCQAFLLAVVLTCSGVSFMPAQVQAETVTEGFSTKSRINTWDFSDESQLSKDFSLYYRNDTTSEGLEVSNGYLYAPTSSTSDFRKAVLNTDYGVNAVSVDVYPSGNKYDGGIMLGVQPGDTGAIVGGTTGNPAILIGVTDGSVNDAAYTLQVRGVTSAKAIKTIKSVTLTDQLYTDYYAQAVNLSVEISGTTLKIKVKVISDAATTVNNGIYEIDVDITTFVESGESVFGASSLEGKIGLFAQVTATQFDNFTLSRKLYSDTSEMVAQTRPNETNSSEKDVRLLAYVDKLEDYKKVSFVLSSEGKTSNELVCNIAYKRVYAGGKLTDTTELYGETGYFVTVLITNYTNLEILNGKDVTVTTTWTKTDGTQITSTRVINVSK